MKEDLVSAWSVSHHKNVSSNLQGKEKGLVLVRRTLTYVGGWPLKRLGGVVGIVTDFSSTGQITIPNTGRRRAAQSNPSSVW